MEQALVVATDSSLVAGASAAASSGISSMGAALWSLAGAFAAGIVACEVKSRACGKRKCDVLEAEVSQLKKRMRKQESSHKVSAKRFREHANKFREHDTRLSYKVNAAVVEQQLNTKMDATEVDAAIAQKLEVNAAVVEQQLNTKMDATEVDAAIAQKLEVNAAVVEQQLLKSKMDATEVDAAIAQKLEVNAAVVEQQLKSKMDATEVDAAIAQKLQVNAAALEQQLNSKMDARQVDAAIDQKLEARCQELEEAKAAQAAAVEARSRKLEEAKAALAAALEGQLAIQLMELGGELAGVSLAGAELFRIAEFSRKVDDLRKQIAQAMHCRPAMLEFFQGGEELADRHVISDFASIIAKYGADVPGEAESPAGLPQVLAEHPDRIPVICTPATTTTPGGSVLRKLKLVAPLAMSGDDFKAIVAKKLSVGPREVKLLRKCGRRLPAAAPLAEQVREDDGSLRIIYSIERD